MAKNDGLIDNIIKIKKAFVEFIYSTDICHQLPSNDNKENSE